MFNKKSIPVQSSDKEGVKVSVAEPEACRRSLRLGLGPQQERAVLLEVLEFLGIPVESQMLVFSKTSHQNPLISPATPRAIYFNDEVYLGWVRGGTPGAGALEPFR